MAQLWRTYPNKAYWEHLRRSTPLCATSFHRTKVKGTHFSPTISRHPFLLSFLHTAYSAPFIPGIGGSLLAARPTSLANAIQSSAIWLRAVRRTIWESDGGRHPFLIRFYGVRKSIAINFAKRQRSLRLSSSSSSMLEGWEEFQNSEEFSEAQRGHLFWNLAFDPGLTIGEPN